MGKPGRKRRAGVREASGRLQRPTVDRLNEMAAVMRRKEQETVLSQPHRGGRAFGSGPDPRRDVHRTVVAGKVVETEIEKPNIRAGTIGTEDKLAESPIGRLSLRHGLRSELMDAGLAYAVLRNRWRGCWGTPRGVGTPPVGSGGEGPTMEAAEKMRQTIIAYDRCMMRVGGAEAVVAVQQLVLVEADTAPEQDQCAIDGLQALAIEMGRLDKTLRPFVDSADT